VLSAAVAVANPPVWGTASALIQLLVVHLGASRAAAMVKAIGGLHAICEAYWMGSAGLPSPTLYAERLSK